MKRIGIAFLLALLCIGVLPNRAPAQQNTVSVCIPVYNSSTGALTCINGWLPQILNGLSTTVTSVKTSPGLLGTLYCYNPNSSVAYIQVFDVAAASSVTLGTTTPKLSFGIPTDLASGTGPTAVGIQFYNGIQVAVTTTATGNTAPSSAMDCNVTYN